MPSRDPCHKFLDLSSPRTSLGHPVITFKETDMACKLYILFSFFISTIHHGALLKLLQPPESNEEEEHAIPFLFRLLLHVLSFDTSKLVP